MTFLLLLWAATRPVETCRVTLDEESTPACLSLRHSEQRRRRSSLSRDRLVHGVVYHCFFSSDTQTRHDLKCSSNPAASVLLCFWCWVEINVSALVGRRVYMYVCVCVSMHVCETTHTQGMYKISLYTFRLLYVKNASCLCVPWVSHTSMCISMLCVCVCVRSRPSHLLLFLHLVSYDQGFKRGQVCSLLALTTWKQSSFIAHLLQVLLGAGEDFSHLSSSPAGVMVGESPNEVPEPIKQAFNFLVYAQGYCYH